MKSPTLQIKLENSSLNLSNDIVRKIQGNPHRIINQNEEGLVFNDGDALDIKQISMDGDYSITVWFKTPLPSVNDFNSLCSAGGKPKSSVPVLVKAFDNHLGVFDSNSGFIDSGYSIKNLVKGKHHLVAIADSAKNTTTFYIDNIMVGKSNIKSNSEIVQIGNNGNEKIGYKQPFGFLNDFRIYKKQLNYNERQLLPDSSQKLKNSKKELQNLENVVVFENVSKSFRFYHEQRKSLFEYLISVFNKKKYFEDLTVLNDISFSVKKGEMIGILGVNGSGKTTILKLMSQIYVPDKGTIITNGKVIPILELGIGFNPDLTAKDNIIIYGLILGFSKKEIKNKIKQIIQFAELEKFLDIKMKNFSMGMYARLAFSTALQVNPDILLVDEVLSVGDIAFQEKSFNAFMDFKRRGKTIIFVSHSPDQIKQYCDKALWIHEGKIRNYGPPELVVNEYIEFMQKH